MLFSMTSALVLYTALASAKPWGPLNYWHGNAASSSGSYSTASSTASAPTGPQTPITFPLSNGFLNVNNATLQQLEENAHGTLPNGPLPTSINATTVPILELIAYNEIFEVAWFSSLLANITNNVPGYQVDSPILRDFLIRTFTAVLGQESLHYLGANGILNSTGNAMVTPCEYVFPDYNLDMALRSSATHTDNVLGALPDAQAAFIANGDSELVPLIGSVIGKRVRSLGICRTILLTFNVGQEGEQDGYYRSLLNLIPSANPFLTRSAGAFLFSEITQLYVVPGSCNGSANNNLFASVPLFGKLNLISQTTQLADQTPTFSVESNATSTSDWYGLPPFFFVLK
jgi:hypothetical protein